MSNTLTREEIKNTLIVISFLMTLLGLVLFIKDQYIARIENKYSECQNMDTAVIWNSVLNKCYPIGNGNE